MSNGFDLTTITSVLSITTFIIGILLGMIIKRAIKLALAIVSLVVLLAVTGLPQSCLEHLLSKHHLLCLQRCPARSRSGYWTGQPATDILGHISDRRSNRTLERLTCNSHLMI